MKTKFYILYVFIASTSLMYSQVRLGGEWRSCWFSRDFCCLYRWIFKQHDLDNMEGDINRGRGIVFPYTDLTQMSGLGDEEPRPRDGINPNYYDNMIVYNVGEGISAIGGTEVEVGYYYYSNPIQEDSPMGPTVLGGTWIPFGSNILTSLSQNPETTVLSYLDERGERTTITVAVLASNTKIEDGTIDIDNDGEPDDGVTLQALVNSLQRGDQETLTTLTQNQDTSVITYTDEDGDTNPITPIVLASNTKIEDGTVDLDKDGDLDDGVTLQEVIENGFGDETLTSISQNQDTSVITYTDEDGDPNPITPVVLASNTKIADGTIDTNDDGQPNTGVTLQELAESLQRGDQETLTTLTQNQDTSVITYTDEDGDPNPITPVVLASNTKIEDGTVDLDKDGDLDDGVTLQEVIENGFGDETLTSISQNQDTSVITYTDEDGDPNPITPVVLASNTKIADGTIDTNDDGQPNTGVTLQELAESLQRGDQETLTTLTQNQDTSVITYTDEDGDPNPITPVVLASNTKIEDGTVDLDKDGDLDDGVTLQEADRKWVWR